MSFRQRGDNLAAFVLASNRAGRFAAEDAARLAAMGARNELRRIIRQRFGSSGRVGASRGFAAAVMVKKWDPTWWSVIDRSVYKKRRTEAVSLAWVFDNAPVIRGKKGWVAVPIRGEAPIANNGRRYAWPREAAAMGWELEIVQVMGKPLKLIMGRRNRREGWKPLYFYIPPYRAKKAIDLDGLHAKWTGMMEGLWGSSFDKRAARIGGLRRAA